MSTPIVAQPSYANPPVYAPQYSGSPAQPQPLSTGDSSSYGGGSPAYASYGGGGSSTALMPAKQKNDNTWLWVAAAIGGTALVGVLAWLALRTKNTETDADKATREAAEAEKQNNDTGDIGDDDHDVTPAAPALVKGTPEHTQAVKAADDAEAEATRLGKIADQAEAQAKHAETIGSSRMRDLYEGAPARPASNGQPARDAVPIGLLQTATTARTTATDHAFAHEAAVKRESELRDLDLLGQNTHTLAATAHRAQQSVGLAHQHSERANDLHTTFTTLDRQYQDAPDADKPALADGRNRALRDSTDAFNDAKRSAITANDDAQVASQHANALSTNVESVRVRANTALTTASTNLQTAIRELDGHNRTLITLPPGHHQIAQVNRKIALATQKVRHATTAETNARAHVNELANFTGAQQGGFNQSVATLRARTTEAIGAANAPDLHTAIGNATEPAREYQESTRTFARTINPATLRTQYHAYRQTIEPLKTVAMESDVDAKNLEDHAERYNPQTAKASTRAAATAARTAATQKQAHAATLRAHANTAIHVPVK